MSQIPPPGGAAPMGYQTPPPQKPQGLAIGALVCGIISLLSFCFWPLAVPLGIVAIVLGVIGRGKAARGEAGGEGLAKTGMFLGIAGVALSIIITIAAYAGLSILGDKIQEEADRMEREAQQQEQVDGTATPTTEPAAP
jgi:hypothetical protein